MKRLFFGAYLLVAFLLCATSGVYADSWQLLTDAASLEAGDKLILACPDKGMTAGVLNESKGYLEAVSSRFSLNTSSVTDLGEGTLVFTLGGSEGQWTLTGPDGRMLGAKETKFLRMVQPFSPQAVVMDGSCITLTILGSLLILPLSQKACSFPGCIVLYRRRNIHSCTMAIRDIPFAVKAADCIRKEKVLPSLRLLLCVKTIHSSAGSMAVPSISLEMYSLCLRRMSH